MGKALQRLNWEPHADLTAVIEALVAGALICFPTETVFGLAGLYGDAVVRDRIYAAKGRPAHLQLPVQIGDAGRLEALVDDPPEVLFELARRFWPGPLTVVMRTKEGSVGVRIPAHPVALAVLQAAGRPLWVTSANRSGGPEQTCAADLEASLGDRIAWLIDGGPRGGGTASSVVDLTEWPSCWRILRHGPVSQEELAAVLA